MGKEKLIIKNFGPIKSVDLDLGKITVLIGQQATGKSTIAKVLSICRYFSYVVNFQVSHSQLDKFNDNEQFMQGLYDWGLSNYLHPNTVIIYDCPLYKFEFKNKLITEMETIISENDLEKNYFETNTRISSNSNVFTELLNELDNLRKDQLKELEEKNIVWLGQKWSPNENFYRLNVKKVMDNPFYIPTERVIQSISISNDLMLADALRDELSKLNRIRRGFNVEMSIPPLSLIYKNKNGLGFVKKSEEKEFHTLHDGASGYQSTIPIVLAMEFYSRFDKRKRTFILEELEQNLFPKAQKKLLDFLVQSVNKNEHNLLLTTHSPYVLTALENLMYASKLGKFDSSAYADKVAEVIDMKNWIDEKNVKVFCLENGCARDILNRDEVLIEKKFLDSISGVINKEFDQLLDIELEIQNKSNL